MVYHLFLWLTVCFWGVSFVATKVVVMVFPPFFAAILRFLIAWVFLWLFTRRKAYGKRKDLVFAGLWGVTLYFVFENLGMVYTLPTNAVLIISLVPLLNLLYLSLFRKQRLTILQVAGAAIAFAGVCVVFLNGNINLRLNPLGDLLIFASAISWVVYTHYILQVEREKPAGSADALAVTRALTGWGVLFLIPFTALESLFGRAHWSLDALGWPFFAGLLFLSVCCSSIGFYLWNMAIRHLGPRYTTNTLYVMPIVTGVAEAVILRSIPNRYTLIGAFFVLLGLYISEQKKHTVKGISPSK
ncbi:MAG: DMT family transporter [Thermotogae bacterium]|nr:DMT family transporter [Thermotogota bacterium]HNR63395.1 DMT family transporter [Thermotogota bacterium]HQN21271.1 DMT family transporter [Thermotogota bacterium]